MAEPTLHDIRVLLSTVDLLLERAEKSSGRDAADAAAGAAWRLADAGAVLRAMCERDGIEGFGITEPTGRGAVLPALTVPFEQAA